MILHGSIIKSFVKDVELRQFVSVCNVDNLVCFDEKNPYNDWCTILYKDSKVIGFMLYTDPNDVKPMFELENHYPDFSLCELDTGPSMFYIPWLFKFHLGQNVSLSRVYDSVHNLFEKVDMPTTIVDLKRLMIVQLVASAKHYNVMVSNMKKAFFKNFLGVSQKWITRLLKYNEIKVDFVKPLLKDIVRYFNQHPNNVKPLLWIAVPLIHVPEMLGLPVYKGGIVHIACAEIQHWLWFKSINNMQHQKTAMWTSEFLNRLKRHIGPRINREKVFKPKSNGAGYTTDIEDLVNMLPPCTRPLVENKRFPLHSERLPLVGMLRKGNVSLKSVEDLLSLLNDKYPHVPPKDLVKRWDYKDYYEKGYPPPYCDKLPECMKCPFNGDKTECIKEFDAKWPEASKKTNIQHFFGPYNWPGWVIYSRNRNK